ncbi:MAG: ABC transporter substrate-binding protein [Tepidanaerobacteraceae bacterium]|jgi:branched-chain amino acid transport system substrate-binding protein|nr:ABC transporter substrate-binding protein [Tepidanaerobacteraceae bacterium]
MMLGSRKKLIIISIIFLLVVSALLAGCGSKQASDAGKPAESGQQASDSGKSGSAASGESSGDVIKVGVYEPMTGASAAGGQMTVEGINLANEMFPEVLGKKIKLFLVDNKTDKTEAANAVSRLIQQDKVSVIIGSYGSSLSMAGGQVAKDAGIPVVGCSPTNPLVTLNNDYYFRVCFIDPFQGKVMAKYAYNTLKAKKAAIIMDVSSDYSVGLSNYFKQAFVELTGDKNAIVAEAKYKTGDQEFTAQLTGLKDLKPDAIFAPGNYGESALLIKQARDLGIDALFLGGDTYEAPEFIQIGGKAVEGVAFSTHYTAEAPVTEVSKQFLDAYKQKYGKDPTAFAALGFDAYLVVRDAIERAGSAEPKAIRDALAKTQDFKGATGIITLDQNGDANKSAVIKQVKDGKFVYIETIQPDK